LGHGERGGQSAVARCAGDNDVAQGVDGDDPFRDANAQGSVSYRLASSLLLRARLFGGDSFAKNNSSPLQAATIPSKAAGPNRLTEVEFTMTIQGQQDVRFWGTRGSATRVEPVIGVISADGKRIRVIPESGGLIEGTFVDNDSIEIFYLENRNGESVAATNVFKRKK
jgi:hypothetical protein